MNIKKEKMKDVYPDFLSLYTDFQRCVIQPGWKPRFVERQSIKEAFDQCEFIGYDRNYYYKVKDFFVILQIRQLLYETPQGRMIMSKLNGEEVENFYDHGIDKFITKELKPLFAKVSDVSGIWNYRALDNTQPDELYPSTMYRNVVELLNVFEVDFIVDEIYKKIPSIEKQELISYLLDDLSCLESYDIVLSGRFEYLIEFLLWDEVFMRQVNSDLRVYSTIADSFSSVAIELNYIVKLLESDSDDKDTFLNTWIKWLNHPRTPQLFRDLHRQAFDEYQIYENSKRAEENKAIQEKLDKLLELKQ